MPSEAEIEAVIRGDPIKADPENTPAPAVRTGDTADVPIQIKKEQEDAKINLSGVAAGDDMFDEVDGPEFVDLTYQGIAEVDGVEHFVCENFKIRQIAQPFVVIRPLSSLYDCIKSSHIVLNPSYQRSVVWDETRASNLITSVLMGYFIPPIVFNVISKSVVVGGRKTIEHKRICVDGKQRLTSVQKFMNGHIGFFDCNHPSKKWYFCHPIIDGVETWSNHNILPDPVKEFFKNKSFCCYEYEELTEETEETMFQLVQRGVALTPAEKMRAMSTEWALFAKQYEDDYDIVVNLAKHNRASGFRITLTIFTMIQEVNAGRRKRASAPALQASPQALIRILESKEPINPLLKLRFKAIFDRIESLVIMSSTQITSTKYEVQKNSVFDVAPDFLRGRDVNHVKTFSPLELIGTAILVSYHMDNRTDEELLEDIKQMRYHLRKMHKDLRVNAQCWITVWEYIMEIEEIRPSASMAVGNGIAGQLNHTIDHAAPETPPLASQSATNISANGNGVAETSTASQSKSKNGLVVNGSSSMRASSKRQRESAATTESPENGVDTDISSRTRHPAKRQRELAGARDTSKKKSRQ